MSAAWLFPGQGSQYVGMATDWAEASPCARAALDEATEALGFDLPRLLAEGPDEVLGDTFNQQPALLAASTAILRAASEGLPEPAFVAGHSLGEYSALVAAGVLGYPDALGLVRERGRLMRQAGTAAPGRMAAVLGLPDEAVEAVCAAVDGVQVANYNAPGQVVISGTVAGVDAATERLRAQGARRVMPLPITIAAHSHLMAPVAGAFAARVQAAPLAEARVPVVANITAQPITRPDAIRAELAGQLTASVRWTATIEAMAAAGVTDYYEIGPGRVLLGLVKRVLAARGQPEPRLVSLDTPESWQNA
jgi:[acyl-carrier-protein] S-malonyltransferase